MGPNFESPEGKSENINLEMINGSLKIRRQSGIGRQTNNSGFVPNWAMRDCEIDCFHMLFASKRTNLLEFV